MNAGNREAAKAGLAVLKDLARETRELQLPPAKGNASSTQQVMPFSVIRGTRGYLERIAHQLNGSYEKGWFDACAVMMRRLVETLIIEVFEKRGIASQIQTASGDFLRLDRLIGKVIAEPSWNLGRGTRRILTEVRELGDNSAHRRRFNAHRRDIDNIKIRFRVAVQELVDLGGWDDARTS